MKDVRLSFSSVLGAPPEVAWAWACSTRGVNEELAASYLQMDFPEGLDALTPETVTLGESIARVPLLLFGFIPIDASELTIAEIGPGYRFLERSPMRSCSLWEHERRIEAHPQGCVLRDDLHFVPRRLRGTTTSFVERLFALRHGRLQREWPTS